MVLFENKNICTGCGCCEKLCPASAIKLREDEKGFLYPKIIEKYCVNCGICKRNCPNISKNSSKNDNLKIFAMKNKNSNIRLSSSSGGFFFEYAKIILDLGGVVFGASYNSINEVIHICVNDLEDLNRLQGAKYVQSDLRNSYSDILDALKKDKYVLFSGTPCQVAGLISYLTSKKVSLEKLFTCDLICHGVPSPKIFKDYLNSLEKSFNSSIKTINFRHKENDYTQNIKITFENGKEYISNYFKNDYFYKLFLDNVILRESCFNCKYANLDRVSDITIGDFWGIEKSISNFDDKNGVSLVLINSEKGKIIFEKLKDNFEYVETSEENCLQHNLVSPTPKADNYDEFWKNYK